MSVCFVWLSMIFCHIVDDYYLQGVLASMKQKKWWEEHAPGLLYQYDYLMALFMHSMSWSFMIMLPLAIYHGFDVGLPFIISFFVNAIIHAVVDDLKANKLKINLIADQGIHLIQILFTFSFLIS